ncbi:putative baseplate assembly protein, partial [Pyxidicoccus sp. 3LFB2]
LTFLLTPGAASATVPEGTRVSGDEGLVFETEQALTMTRAKLTSLLVRGPRLEDRAESFSDRSPGAGDASGPFLAFAGTERVEHSLYLACDALFSQPGAGKRWLEFTWRLPPQAPIDWSFWNGKAWQALPAAQPAGTQVWRLELQDIAPVLRELQGRTARWLRGQPRQLPSAPLQLQSLRAQAEVVRSGVAPELAFHNAMPLDLSRDLLPFGELPRFNDVFYLASGDVLRSGGEGSQPRQVRLSATWNTAAPWQAVPTTSVTATLSWEVWDGTAWSALGRSTRDGGLSPFVDGTRALTQSGEVVLPLPGALPETSVNGRTGRWLRIRLSGGGYGDPTLNTSRPPVLSALKLSYQDTVSLQMESCLSCNEGTWEDLTANVVRREVVTPFWRTPDPGRALYLGFDRPFGTLPVSLFAQVEPPRPEEVAIGSPGAAQAGAARPQLAWEYRGASGWSPLPVEDETEAFRRGGLVRFLGPAGLVLGREFGREGYWLRARWLPERTPDTVRLRGVLLNTVWASHATTVKEEVLGSSTGAPAQTFHVPSAPVLEGFLLEVLEDDAWGHWLAVPDFLASGPRDRHYTLDVERGEVRFGDGLQGMIPPAGSDNVRLSYRTGGGASGNVPADTLTRLDSSLPYVASVSQPEPATGGADLEPLPVLAERQARLLRHGGQAVTVEDFEDLAREASPAVARVRAIAPTFDPISQADNPNPDGVHAGRVQLVVIPHGVMARPAPDPELLRQVELYLRARCAPATELQVSGPAWVEANVQAHLTSRRLSEGEAVRERARDALARYLHPLSGGPGGAGWDFGQWPSTSELVALLSRLEGVDHVVSVSLQAQAGSPPSGPATLLFVEASRITVELSGSEA